MIQIILLALGVFLVVKNISVIKTNVSDFDNIFEIRDNTISEAELALGAVRKEFAETLTDIQVSIVDMEKKIETLEQGRRTKVEYVVDDKINTSELVYTNTSSEVIKDDNKNTATKVNETKVKKKPEVAKEDVINDINFNKSLTNEEKMSQETPNITKKDNDNRGDKTSIVKKLLDEGKSIEEICESTGYRKGEVLLIKDLYKR